MSIHKNSNSSAIRCKQKKVSNGKFMSKKKNFNVLALRETITLHKHTIVISESHTQTSASYVIQFFSLFSIFS